MRFIILILITITLCGCKDQEIAVVDYTAEKDELNLSIDRNEYIKAFEVYLNEGVYNNNIDNIDSTKISNNLISQAYIKIEDSITMGSKPPSLGIDIEQTEFPIVDVNGDIIRYGTKDESDASFEIYNAQPYYRVDSIEIYSDILLFKIYNKGERTNKVYEVFLDSDMKMDSFEILEIES